MGDGIRHGRQLAKAVPALMAAVERAAQQTDRQPTAGQVRAGNYRKGIVNLFGFKIAIETPAGAWRRGVGRDGKPWAVQLPCHYGYIQRTEGADGDAVDVYVAADPTEGPIVIVDQVDAFTGEFDEHKLLIGWRHTIDALLAYEACFSDGLGWKRRGAISVLTPDGLRAWLKVGDLKKPIAYRPPPLRKHNGGHHPGAFSRWYSDLAKAEPDVGDRLLNAADAAQEALAAGLARAFAWMRGQAGQIADAAQDGPQAAGEAVRATSLGGKIQDGLEAVDAAFQDGTDVARETGWGAGRDRRIAFSFDGTNDQAKAAVSAQKAQLIRQVTDEQVAAVRQILTDAFAEGIGPPDMARRIRDVVGLTTTQAQHVVNYRKELEELRPGALNRALRDRRFDRTVARAIETETPLDPAYVDRLVEAYQRRYIAFRATTIARTESLRAANAGYRTAIEAAAASGALGNVVVIKRWMATKDSRTRDSHRDLDGREVEGVDTPFTTTTGASIRWPHDEEAPAHETINCRCTLSLTVRPR